MSDPVIEIERMPDGGIRFRGFIPDDAVCWLSLHANSFERWAVEHAGRDGAKAADWLIGLQTIVQALERRGQ